MKIEVYQDFSARVMARYGNNVQEANIFIITMKMLKPDEVKKILGALKPEVVYTCPDSPDLMNFKIGLQTLFKKVYG